MDNIVITPGVLAGKPHIKGTRISVEHIHSLLLQNWTYEQILSNYPRLTKQDIEAVTKYVKHLAP